MKSVLSLWTKEEDEKLARLLDEGMNFRIISKELNRGYDGTAKRANRLGLHRNNLGLCRGCGVRLTDNNRTLSNKTHAKLKCDACYRAWLKSMWERTREERNRYSRQSNKFLRLEALSHYSDGKSVCVCCGENNVAFLTLDHIDDDGSSHRKITGEGTTFYRWLRKNNYPNSPRLQVLCFNCNSAKERFGTCPHHA